MQKYPSGSRGSPAKGVVWDNRSTSSNLVFCATVPETIHSFRELFLFPLFQNIISENR